MKRIIEFNHIDAKRYFLKEESYFNFDLPTYFVFQPLLEKVSKKLEGKNLQDFYGCCQDPENGKDKPTYPCDFENVNYKFLNNKDGRFAWRPYQLIHPALYVSLVHIITEEKNWKLISERFNEFSANPKIKCQSIPIESETKLSDKATAISNWWHSIEQQSIELALEYEYVLHTDISDCYGSIYTHSIPWALHSKEVAKAQRNNKSLIGNSIDKILRDMGFGQTNCIPQGSILMDFIAEMVLGYGDLELSRKIENENIVNYQIIRYRDDYRIFSNNPKDADRIAKLLTEILIDLGMRLNTQKTFVSNNVVRDSIKPDKLYWILQKQTGKSLQESLLVIHALAQKFPNSGSLNKALNKFFNKIKGYKNTKENIQVLISIIVDIAYKNPRTYPISSAILSKLLSFIETDKSLLNKILDSIANKFNNIPNTGHLKVWLQRVTLKIDRQKEYDEELCKKVNNQNIEIWNSDWLSKEFKNIITTTTIINEEIIEEIDKVIKSTEIIVFDNYAD